ncbi:MAG: type IX secretion system membrane protein PorP/SprF [Saprospiraceae bacterium]|nr:type IX secretion system membrane protein PorP/SprF [Saprospiraceae bacterium]
MMTINKFLFALAGFLLIGFAGAQDIHFTQYEFSPIHVNPAQTGAFNGSYRIGGIYRDQGRTAIKGAAYRTPMLYTDVTFPFALRKQDWTSLGLNIIDDRSGEIGLGSTKTAASAAYHFALDKMRRTVISLGAQYARATHNIKDAQDAVFPGNLLPTPNSGDNSKLQQKTSYSDISAGLSLSTKLGAKTPVKSGCFCWTSEPAKSQPVFRSRWVRFKNKTSHHSQCRIGISIERKNQSQTDALV